MRLVINSDIKKEDNSKKRKFENHDQSKSDEKRQKQSFQVKTSQVYTDYRAYLL